MYGKFLEIEVLSDSPNFLIKLWGWRKYQMNTKETLQFQYIRTRGIYKVLQIIGGSRLWFTTSSNWKSDWMKIKKINSSYWESIWFYAWEVDHGSDFSTTICDEAISNGPTRLALNFYWLGEKVWYST